MLSNHHGMKLKISNKKTFGMLTNMWKVNNILPNKQCIKREVTKEVRKCSKMYEREKATYKSLWNATNAVHRGKFIIINAYINKKRKLSHQQLNLSPKTLKKKEQTKPKASTRKEMIKIRMDINDIEERKTN